MLNTSNKQIRLSGVIEESIVDGPGMRFVIFTQGCLKRCFKCHNAETQPLDKGYLEAMDSLVEKWRKNPLIKGITLSGGEPFLQARACLYLAQKAHETGLDVFLYSGYYYEDLIKQGDDARALLEEADYLMDGPFEYAIRNLNLLFRGSANQRFIDLKKTTQAGRIIVYDEENDRRL